MKKVFFIALSVLSFADAHAVCFVDHRAMGADNGTSWTDAYADLQKALSSSTCTEIWVAAGTYKPTSTTNTSVSFAVTQGVQLLGGFNGTETSAFDRDPSKNVVVLSGDIGADDLSAGHGDIDQQTSDIVGSNSSHVLTLDGSTATPITDDTKIDGFTITGGDSSGDGGGLYCKGRGAGGECSPSLVNVIFSGNRAAGRGGAIFFDLVSGGVANPFLQNMDFHANAAHQGGAVAVDGASSGASSFNFAASKFTDDAADAEGGAIFLSSVNDGIVSASFLQANMVANAAHEGGAIYFDADSAQSANIGFRNSVVESNRAEHRGGAIYLNAPDAGVTSIDIVGARFSNNSAHTGGAIFADGEDLGSMDIALSASTFDGNSALLGGAVFAEDYGTEFSSEVDNCTFAFNAGTSTGGALDVETDNSQGLLINNSTFYGNHADGTSPDDGLGGAIYAFNLPSLIPLLKVTNTIFWANSASAPTNGADIYNQLIGSGGDVLVEHSVVDGGCPDNTACEAVSTENPQLSSLGYFSSSVPVMLPGAGGSAVDAGHDASCESTDQRGVDRPQGTHCDIGAVELNPSIDDKIFADSFEE